VTVENVQALRAAGLPDDAVRDAIVVCGIFNVIDRLADSFDFTPPTPENLRKEVRFLVKVGYKI